MWIQPQASSQVSSHYTVVSLGATEGLLLAHPARWQVAVGWPRAADPRQAKSGQDRHTLNTDTPTLLTACTPSHVVGGGGLAISSSTTLQSRRATSLPPGSPLPRNTT